MSEDKETIFGGDNSQNQQNSTSHPTPGAEEESGNQPYAKYRDSPLVLTIWEDSDQQGNSYFKAQLQQVYVKERNEQGEATDFGQTDNIDLKHADRAAELMKRAHQEHNIKREI